MSPQHDDRRPSTKTTCPLCGQQPRNAGDRIGYGIALAIIFLAIALAFYWPIRWVGELYVALFLGWQS